MQHLALGFILWQSDHSVYSIRCPAWMYFINSTSLCKDLSLLWLGPLWLLSAVLCLTLNVLKCIFLLTLADWVKLEYGSTSKIIRIGLMTCVFFCRDFRSPQTFQCDTWCVALVMRLNWNRNGQANVFLFSQGECNCSLTMRQNQRCPRVVYCYFCLALHIMFVVN